ncbi:MAG TPA: DUF1592 domain-containing protein [Polyangiaceae bacterium]|nr:DUF1592 domain-containing protein [Polyangiaceae bacterium]
MARLTRREYANALRDLLGHSLTSEQMKLLPSDIAGSSGFSTAGLMSQLDVQGLAQVAEQVALATDLKAAVSCDAAATEEACALEMIRSLGRRAFRRPLDPSEENDYRTLYSTTLRQQIGLSHEQALRTLIEAILQAPAFLYHWEIGAQPAQVGAEDVIRLNGYEVASRLAFFLWGSIPDETLLDAAGSGALEKAETIEAEARRLLQDARARGTIDGFFTEWLELTQGVGAKSAADYPTYTDELGRAMGAELLAFARHVSLDTEGTLADLLTSPESLVDASLAGLYGVPAPAAAGLTLTRLDPETRPGILTRAGFLAVTSNAFEGDPTKRGVIVRKKILCDPPRPPPANVPSLPAPSPDATVRERHEQHFRDPACAGCHRLTDFIGFGFGHFDAIGAYRELERGKNIDASGVIVGLDGRDTPFQNVGELTRALAESPQVRACFARQLWRYALGREESRADAYSLETALDSFERSRFAIRELLVAITTSRSFLYRAPASGEITR